MTARTMPADPHPGLRQIPWRRIAGVTWRQHRITLAGVAVLLGALAVWLWRAGASLHHAYAAAVACHPASSAACQNLIGVFDSSATSNFMGSKGPGGVLLQLVPVLIGAFAGAPVLARELETGTFRFAWTQGLRRWRWALGKLVLLAVVLAAAGSAFGLMISWYFQPEVAADSQAYVTSPFAALFGLREVTFPAWTLAAFALGALAGMLIRRVVPAIVATFAVYAGLVYVATALLRERYLAPLVTNSIAFGQPGTSTAWIINHWFTKDGRFAFGVNPPAGIINRYCSSFSPASPASSASSASSPGKAGGPGFVQCLVEHGYTQWTSYQPASRFWPFQWIEGGWLLALSALLIASAIWLVHRRAA